MSPFRRPGLYAASLSLLHQVLLLAGAVLALATAGANAQGGQLSPPVSTPVQAASVPLKGFEPLGPFDPAPPAETEGSTLVPDQDADGLLSAGGLPSTQNTTRLDGASLTQSFSAVAAGAGRDPVSDPEDDSDAAEQTTGPAHGLARGRHAGVAYVFSQAATREFRVANQDYSAQGAHTGGAVLTTLSRSGADGLHGSGFFTLRASAFAAAEPYAIATSYNAGVVSTEQVKPHDLREGFGGSLGGPLRAPLIRARARLFGFYAFDAQRRGFPAISSPADPNFYNLTASQRALLGNRGVSSAAIDHALSYLSSLTGKTDRRSDQTLNFARVDWLAHARYELAIEYNRVRWSAPAGLVGAPVVARGRASLGNVAGSLDTVLLRVQTSLGRHSSNQAHLEYLRDVQYETPQPPLAQEPAISPGGFAPEVNIGPSGLLFGTPATVSQGAFPDERRIEVGDTLTLSRGHHTLAFGGEIAFVHDRVAALTNAAGTFNYDSTGAGGLADFITDFTFNADTIPNGGCPSIFSPTHVFCFRSYTQSFGGSRLAFSTQDYAGFVEDVWRPRAGLVVHAGLRFDYTLLPVPLAPNAALDAIFGTRAATGVFPEDRNNFGPRLAIAWAPLGRGRGVVHAGYGLFYGRLPGATIRAALADTALPVSTTRVRITPAVETTCTAGGTQGFGYPCAFSVRPSGTVLQTATAVVFDRRLRLPMIQQGSLVFERSFGRTTLTAGYVLNLDRQLPGSTDLNIAPSTALARYRLSGGTGALGVRDGETFTLPLYTARITPSFGPVTELVSHSNGSYHALVLTARSPPSPGLTLRGEYTWSKAIDDAPDLSATPRTDSQLDPFANGYDKALSALNYPWVVRAEADWRPHLRASSFWMRRAANGWALAPLVDARAGRPYSFDLSGGTHLSGGHESLNGSGGALYLPTVGRNTLRLPPTVALDLRLSRGFAAGVRTHVQLSAEASNLLNRRNVSSVSQRAYLVGTPVAGVTPLVFQTAAAIASEGRNTLPFGAPTAASTASVRARQVQLQMKMEF